jgi:hypothetical protein
VIKFVSDLIQHYVIKFVGDLIQHYVIKFVGDLIQHYVIKFVGDLIQHYVIKFVGDLRQVGGFPPPIKLTVALNIITVTKVFIMANMKNSKSRGKQEVDVR